MNELRRRRRVGAPRPHGAGSRNEQVVRVLRLLDHLARPGGVDLYELAERHGASVRTIRRDLAALKQAGILVHDGSSVDGPRKRWMVHDAERQRLAQVKSAGRALAMAHAPRPPGVLAELDDVAARLAAGLGPGGLRLLERLDACFSLDDSGAWTDGARPLLWPLVAAIAERRLCRVRYAPPGHEGEGRWLGLAPLQLLTQRGQAFLIASVPELPVAPTLRVRCIEALEVLDGSPATPPRGWTRHPVEPSLSELTWAPWVRFRLRFSPSVAPVIRGRVWHPAQALSDLRDGGVELEFDGPRSPEVAAWLASWGQDVEVMAPARLRASLRELGGWLVETYR